MVTNNSNFFITAQKEPNWGPDEDENVKRRLTIFTMKPLAVLDQNVSNWLKVNAMHCLVWAGVTVRENIDIVPICERYFYNGTPVTNRRDTLIQHVNKRICIRDVTQARPPVIELFNSDSDQEHGTDDETQVMTQTPPATPSPLGHTTPPGCPDVLLDPLIDVDTGVQATSNQ